MEMPVINSEFLHINVYAHTVGTRPSFSSAPRRRGKVVREQRVSHSCNKPPALTILSCKRLTATHYVNIAEKEMVLIVQCSQFAFVCTYISVTL